MKVYIVRHGQVLHNAKKVYSNENEDLNEVGLQQAKELKSKINFINYDIIISSPLIRAKHTAEIINVKNKNIIFDDRLEERNPGDLNGKPISFTNREEYWNFNSKIQYGTSENMKVFFNRVFDFLDDLKNKKYESVLIVAHSGVSKAFSAYFQGINDGKFLEHGLKNCEIKEYEL
ncbi:MAG: histidine phosphatase family protein [Bacilli bacterium]|nr:histidine phosphatase family protein [Bacilli bacterium]